ncbi:MAG: D-tyrosyl-tRNA(Tyr) deacylase [Phycisphaeraceae bacterium]|nr:D-tyrosyl-tRNA(Tyr) deacylase [Phycisphaeraceae bacterium]
MRAVVQRVSRAMLTVDGRDVASFDAPGGLVVLAGLEERDTADDRRWMAEKISNLRVFADEQGRMNLSVLDVGGSVLMVPNFTVAGDATRGRRPSFDNAMQPPRAAEEFALLVAAVRTHCPRVCEGVFGAHMHVELVNDGPVTIVLHSPGTVVAP